MSKENWVYGRPRALDLFCGAGGAGMGLFNAGFSVTGVDINYQPYYPHNWYQADALTFPLGGYDFIWASPPCQAYTSFRHINTARGRSRPTVDLVAPIRERLVEAGVPFIIENVVGAPLRRDVRLCGTMFGLRVFRHRLFESNIPLIERPHHKHTGTVGPQFGRGNAAARLAAPFVCVHSGGAVKRSAEAMGIDWADGYGVSQAIPPAYSEYLGRQVMAYIKAAERVR